MCSYVCTYVITPKQTLRSVQTGSYLKYTLQCSTLQCSVPVVIAMRKSIRGRVSPFRMQREPAPWPSLALNRLLLVCPFALWMRQSPAYRPPAERPNQCFVHTEMPPRQHYHRPARWRQSKRERKEQFQCHSSFNQLSKWAQWQTHSCKANAECKGKYAITLTLQLQLAIRIECISIALAQTNLPPSTHWQSAMRSSCTSWLDNVRSVRSQFPVSQAAWIHPEPDPLRSTKKEWYVKLNSASFGIIFIL